MNENHSDNQLGRARVQDSPELLAYYKELETLGAGALWTVAKIGRASCRERVYSSV